MNKNVQKMNSFLTQENNKHRSIMMKTRSGRVYNDNNNSHDHHDLYQKYLMKTKSLFPKDNIVSREIFRQLVETSYLFLEQAFIIQCKPSIKYYHTVVQKIQESITKRPDTRWWCEKQLKKFYKLKTKNESFFETHNN